MSVFLSIYGNIVIMWERILVLYFFLEWESNHYFHFMIDRDVTDWTKPPFLFREPQMYELSISARHQHFCSVLGYLPWMFQNGVHAGYIRR